MDHLSLYTQIQQYNTNLLDKEKTRLLNSFNDRSTSFAWLKGATLKLPVSDLENLITDYNLSVPRTGHLGNWQEIMAGRACALDHNGTSCLNGFAYPYIYDLNQTENIDLSSGDVVYMVGSLINGKKRVELPLYTWNGYSFVLRSREFSYFVPFTFTKLNHDLISLSDLQKSPLVSYGQKEYHSSLWLKNEDKIREIFHVIISYLLDNSNGGLKLKDIVDRVVCLDGSVVRKEIRIENKKIKIGQNYYKNINEFIDDMFVPFRAADSSQWYKDNVENIKPELPFASLPMLCVIDYLILRGNKGFNVYLEWGAFGSAAYPPRMNGYYKQKSSIIKKIIEVLTSKDNKINPTFFLLLPSSIFNLLPCDAYPIDVELTRLLFEDVFVKVKKIDEKNAALMIETIEKIALQWWLCNKEKLSNYYKSRYTQRRSVFHQAAEHDYAQAVFDDAFMRLTFHQASILVGGLFRAAKKNKEDGYALAS